MENTFKNRIDAATQLAAKLSKYKNTSTIILAIPRGGVPIGYHIAKELKLPLEIVLSKKIGYPSNPEYAIGSVSLQGVLINDTIIGIPKDYIEKESKKILHDLEVKFKRYMGNRAPMNLEGKNIIIVDDGIATGNTIKATILAVKKNKPKKIIVAVPVAPYNTANKLSEITDEFISLYIPKEFYGVGQFYDDFSQVSDDEVIELLTKNKMVLNNDENVI